MAGVVRRHSLILALLLAALFVLTACEGAVTNIPPTPTSVIAIDDDARLPFGRA
ncbi:MAG: hypothetical protein R2856_31040 [Caldilineaceae bacterium]